MLAMRTGTEASIPKTNPNPLVEVNPKVSLYEQCREERIKENLQRMQNLGILNLARKLKPETRPVKRKFGHSSPALKSTPPLQPSRRYSRLENTTPVIYSEGVNGKGKKSKREGVVIGKGPRLEVYTEEHEELLGNTERSWTCFVDGYDKDGKRIYDPVKGKTCHQCRQKTLGHRTQFSECDMVQGQFCGDCLLMRYGEHVLEALENPNWICPVCRGICNFSLCRNHKGWVPTGPIYRRIAKLGYKSVAHYLIQTKQAETDDASPNEASAKRSLSFQEAKSLPNIADDDVLPEEVLKLQKMENQNGDPLKKKEDENTNENPNSARRSLSFFLPYVDEEVSKLQNMENQNDDSLKKEEDGDSLKKEEDGDSLKKEEDENTNEHTNSARQSLSSFLPSVDDETSLVDVQVVGYLEPSKQDKQEHSSAHIGDDLPRNQEMTEQNVNLVTRADGYLLPGDSQTLLALDVEVLCNEIETGGNSLNTRETRSKWKAALEPNPDSIGGRLRQRRRSQSGL